jgi:hypothetical protein
LIRLKAQPWDVLKRNNPGSKNVACKSIGSSDAPSVLCCATQNVGLEQRFLELGGDAALRFMRVPFRGKTWVPGRDDDAVGVVLRPQQSQPIIDQTKTLARLNVQE